MMGGRSDACDRQPISTLLPALALHLCRWTA